MDPFNRKKLKALEERLTLAENRITLLRKHINVVTQGNLYLVKLTRGITTPEMQAAARDEAEEIMGQGKQLLVETTGDKDKADELWNKYGRQDLSRMNRMNF